MKTFIIVFAIIVLTLTLRSPSYSTIVVDRDEGEYLCVADSILHGGVPYREVWDNKGALLYFIYAFIIKLTNRSLVGFRIFTAIWVACTVILIFFFGKKLHNRTCGVMAALFFIAITSHPSYIVGGLAAHPEIFFILPVLGGAYIVLFSQWAGMNIFLSGVLFGLAFNIKTISVFDFAAFLLIIVLMQKEDGKTFSEMPKALFAFSGGFIIPMLAVAGYFQYKGCLGDLFSAYFTSGLQYVFRAPGWHAFIYKILRFTKFISFEFWSMLIFAFTALISYALGFYGKNEKIKYLLIWAVFVFFGITIHRGFWPHTFIQALPAVSLLGAFCVSTMFSLRPDRKIHLFLCLYLAISLTIFSNPRSVLRWALTDRKAECKETCYKVAGYLKKDLSPEDYIFVCNDITIVYFLTEAKIPTRYPYTDLMINGAIYGYKWIKTVDEVKKALDKNPAYIIFYKNDVIITKYADVYLQDYLKQHYVFAAVIDGCYIYTYKGRHKH